MAYAVIWPRFDREPDVRCRKEFKSLPLLEVWSLGLDRTLRTNGSASNFISMTKSMRERSRSSFVLFSCIYTEQSGFSLRGNLPHGALSEERDVLTMVKFGTCGEMASI